MVPSLFHKDAPPERTIARLSTLLSGLGFAFPRESIFWSNPFPYCFSCSLTDPEYPLLFSNGKGVSREYALAGGYAEFVERLQCYSDLFFNELGLVLRDSFHCPEFVRVQDLYREDPLLMEDITPSFSRLPVEELECIPMVDLAGRRVRLLPYKLMLAATRSNGMCAGNTPAEALVQGICEVMERFVIRELVEGRADLLPTLSLQDLPLKSPVVLSLLEDISREGLRLTVKDCSMGGRWPVLAVVIEDPSGGASVSFGSDPSLETALVRCVWEVYQGRERNFLRLFDNRPWDHVHYRFFSDPYLLVDRLLPSGGSPAFEGAFLRGARTNRERLAFLLDRLSLHGRRLFVRDFSFLGFPSYYVYVEGMSSIVPPDPGDLELLYRDQDRILSLLFRLPRASREEREEWACLVEAYLWRREGGPGDEMIARLFRKVPLFRWMNVRLLLALVFMELGEYSRALRALREPMDCERRGHLDVALPVDPLLWEILAFFCERKLEGLGDGALLGRLQEAFGATPYGPSLGHLVRGDFSNFYFQEDHGAPPRKFHGLPIPQCESLFHCSSCPCRKWCYISGWLKRRGAILKKKRAVKQEALLDFLLGVCREGAA